MQRPHHVAAPAKPDAAPRSLQVVAGVNDECHTWRGHLDQHGGLVLGSPRIVAVYWDPFFNDPRNVERMDQFFRDVAKTTWMRGLTQYGIQPLTLVTSVVIADPPPAKLDVGQLEDKLVGWLDSGKIGVKPARREKRLLYVLLTPGTTELTNGDLSSKTDFSGYHTWGRYHPFPTLSSQNLFWAAIPMPSVPGLSFTTVADILTPTLCHEMSEAFTDRNGNGYKAPNGCEIGDVCESEGADRFGHWRIERYWSDADQVCFPVRQGAPYSTFVLQTGTPIDATDGAANFHWAVGDYNGDGIPDLFGIKTTNTGSGKVEVHVLDGGTNYQQFLLHTPTMLDQTDGASKFRLLAAPLNRAGIADVFGLKVKATASGRLEVQVLDDLGDFKSFALQTPTPIDATDAATNFHWAVDDFDQDGVSDLYAIKTTATGTGKVEVHVLAGMGPPLHAATPVTR